MSLAAKAREFISPPARTIPWVVMAGVAGASLAVVFAKDPRAGVLILAVLGGCLLFAWALGKIVPTILGLISDYFAGFVERRFFPESEQDVIALCHRDNGNIQVRGYDNAKLYFQRPNTPAHTTVCLRRFNRVLKLDPDRNLISVQAGSHFGDLLPLLESRGLWLENYPNYHFISVGACIATPVHGSNLKKPFLADLVESVRYYDREKDKIVELHRQDDRFCKLIFNQDGSRDRIFLSVNLKTCRRQYYHLTTHRQPVELLCFDDPTSFAGGAQHYGVRINSPLSRQALLQAYRIVSSNDVEKKGLLAIKADSIGRKWNLLQRNVLLSFVQTVGAI